MQLPATFRADVAATWNVLVRPVATFRALGERTPVFAPWVVASLVSVVVTLLMVSISQRASAHLLATMDSPETAEQVRGSLARMKVMSLAAAPLALGIRWAAAATVLWAVSVLVTGRTTFRGVLCVVAYSSLPGILGRGVDLGVTWFEGPEFDPQLVPQLSSATSLGVLLPAVQSPWPRALLDHLTLFGVWGIVLTAVGFRERFALGWGRAAAAVVPVWTLFWVFAAAADVVGRSLIGEVRGFG
jgi:hypothetical protein